MAGSRFTWLWMALVVAMALAPAAGADARKPRPNLHELSLKAPVGTRLAGSLVTVRDRVVNRGRATAGRSTVGFYLSRDAKLGRGDTRIGARAVKPLRPGRRSTGVKSLRLPAATPAGTFRLLACADYLHRVRESSERDNCVAAPDVMVVKAPPVEPQPNPDPLPSPATPNDPTPVNLTSPAGGSATNAADVAFSGDAAPGSLVTVSVRTAGAEVRSLQALPGDDGHWSASASGLPEGSYTASAQQTDSFGRTQTSAENAFRVDRTAPAPTISHPAGTTADTSPVADGTRGSAEGDLTSVTVKLYDAQGALILAVPVNSPDAAWSAELETDLGEGTYKVAVEQADSAGNLGRSAENVFQVDDTGPLVTVTSPANDARTSDQTPTVSGTAEGAAPVTVKLYSGPNATGTPLRTLAPSTQAAGSWSLDLETLQPGDYTVQASQPDTVGNVGTSAPHTFTVDRTAPVVTIAHPSGPTKDTTPTFDGTAGTATGDLAAITVTLARASGGTVPSITTTATNGTWSVTPTSALPEDTYTATVHQSDSAGNSATSSRTFVVDTTAPTVTVAAPTHGTDPSKPTFSGTAEASGTVTVDVFSGATASGTPVSTLSAGGQSWHVDQPTTLSDGKYTIVAKQTDAAGNTGTSNPLTFTIDTLGPQVTLSQPADGAITNDTTPTFSGTAEDTTPVTVRVSAPGSALTATPSSGNWSVTPGTALPQGVYTVQAEQSDSAANVGRSTVHSFEIDTTAPSLTLTVKSGNTGVHVVADDPNFAALTCTVDGQTAALVPAGGKEGDVSVTGEGGHTVGCTATDKAGNSQTDSKTFTLDSTPPAVGLTTPAAGVTIDDPTPTFSGPAGSASGDASTVTVKVFSSGGAQVGTLTGQVSGSTWSVTPTANLAEGGYTARAEQSDAAGNTGTSPSHAFTIGPATMLTAGDIGGCEDGNDAAGTAALLRARPQGIVQTLGDNVYGNAQYADGTLADFQNCYGPNWGSEKARTHPAIGNHEYKDPAGGAAGYFAYFGAAAGEPGKGWYSYELGAWHVVVLNSNCSSVGGCSVGSDQEKWLKADLAAHPNACTAAVWHHPLFTSDASTGLAGTTKPLYQDLYDAHAELNLVGHAHEYERFGPQNPSGGPDSANGIVEIVAGMGGESHSSFGTIRPNSLARNVTDFGILQLTLHQSSWSWQFVPVAGASYTDSGSASCH